MESLRHVHFVCPAYVDLRGNLSRELQAGLDDDFFILHRNRWTWKQMRRIRAYVVSTHERRIALAGGKRKVLAKQLQVLADAACARMIHSSSPCP